MKRKIFVFVFILTFSNILKAQESGFEVPVIEYDYLNDTTYFPEKIPNSLSGYSATPYEFKFGCTNTFKPKNGDIVGNYRFFYNPAYSPMNDLNPFISDGLDGWGVSHGTPQIISMSSYGFTQNYNAAKMWAYSGYNTIYQQEVGEGILGNLFSTYHTSYDAHPIEAGKAYVLTFYRSAFTDIVLPAFTLSELNIFLLKCTDLAQFRQDQTFKTTVIPSVPNNAQQIYCEKNISTNFSYNPVSPERIAVEFTATDNYDLMWIFPRQKIGNPGKSWVILGEPRITEKDEIVKGNGGYYSPNDYMNPFPGNYTLSLNNYYRFFEAEYTWRDNGGNSIVSKNEGKDYFINTPGSNAVTYDLYYSNFGSSRPILNFTYQLSFPTAVTPSENTCSSPYTGIVNPVSILSTKQIMPLQQRKEVDTLLLDNKSVSAVHFVRKNVINFRLSEDRMYSIEVYDMLGRKLKSVPLNKYQEGSNVLDISNTLSMSKAIFVKFIDQKGHFKTVKLLNL